MFGEIVGKPTKLYEIDKKLLKTALENNINDARSIYYYGIDGLIEPSFNGFCTGKYQYGERENFIGVFFSLKQDSYNKHDSTVFVSRVCLFKNGKLLWENRC